MEILKNGRLPVKLYSSPPPPLPPPWVRQPIFPQLLFSSLTVFCARSNKYFLLILLAKRGFQFHNWFLYAVSHSFKTDALQWSSSAFLSQTFYSHSYVQTLINKIWLTVHEKPGQGLNRNVTAGPEFVISEKCANISLFSHTTTSPPAPVMLTWQ